MPPIRLMPGVSKSANIFPFAVSQTRMRFWAMQAIRFPVGLKAVFGQVSGRGVEARAITLRVARSNKPTRLFVQKPRVLRSPLKQGVAPPVVSKCQSGWAF